MRKTSIAAGIIVAAFVLIVLSAIFGTWYTVDQSERAVLTNNGAYAGTIEPGLHFKWPFIQSVTHVSLQQRAAYWGFKNTNAVMQAYSRDQQPAELRVSVLWHVLPDKLQQLYQQYGGDLDVVEEKLVARKTPQAVKTVFGQYTAVSAIQERAKFNNDVTALVSSSIDADAPIAIDGVNVENIDYSDAYEQSVEARMLAEVEVQKRQQELAQQKIAAQITVTNAQAEADSKLAVARAGAEATKIQGEATAAAIKARGDALKDNPGLVQLTQAERWDGRLPTTMLPGSALPMLNLQQTLQ